MPHAELLDRGHPFRQWKSWAIPGAGITMSGYSRSNDKTFFLLPELKAGVDCGLVEGWQPDTVFLTHTHMDHSKDLDYVAVKETGVDIYLPAAAVPYAEGYIRATSELNHNAAYDPSLAPAARLHGVRGGDEFSIGKRGAHRVRVVDCEHKVPCVGFAISSVKRAIRPEFEALKADGRLLAAKRREGVEIDHEVVTPLVAFLGDTRPDVFTRSPWLLDYPVVVTECTFLGDDQLERARRIGHTVWSELRPVVEANPATTFVLTHFSLRHTDPEIVAFFDKQGLPNVLAWAHPASRLPESYQ
ncbi:MBL fold metallo-hydrolase [Dactylosporangium sp. CA-152071]|uniref:MBL fold metallo-hydrolase n=1 Tax=Dactylosporangium sp. CA-152071 TaxID=3239933 RepID=UPI003D8DC797